MNHYFPFPNVFLLGKQEHSHAIYSSLRNVRKKVSRERVIVILGFIRQYHFQTRKQVQCFIKMIWPSFKGLRCVSPCTVPHENMSEVGKTLQETLWIILQREHRCTDQACPMAQWDAGAASSAAARILQMPPLPSERFCRREQGGRAAWVSY